MQEHSRAGRTGPHPARCFPPFLTSLMLPRAPKRHARSVPGSTSFPVDPGTDLFSAATFQKVAVACCLGSLGKTRDLPPWLSLEADARRALVAAILRGGIPLNDTYPGKANLSTIARRVGACTESLMILAPRQTAGYLPMILRCKSRWCPPCALSMGYKRAFQVVGACRGLERQDSLSHVVYTTPNVTHANLAKTLRALVKAWKAMHGMNGGKSHPDPAAASVRGAVRNLEVTYNPTADDYHPHIHALLDVGRLDQDAYSDAWDRARAAQGLPACQTLVYMSRLYRKASHLDGVQPVCTPIAATSADPGDVMPADPAPSAQLLDAAFEVSKYCVKPLDLTGSDGYPTQDLATVALALKGLHVSQATGSIRDRLSPIQQPEKETTYNRIGSYKSLITRGTLDQAKQVTAAVLADQAARSIVARHYSLATILEQVTEYDPCQEAQDLKSSSRPTNETSAQPEAQCSQPAEPPITTQLDWLAYIAKKRPTSTPSEA